MVAQGLSEIKANRRLILVQLAPNQTIATLATFVLLRAASCYFVDRPSTSGDDPLIHTNDFTKTHEPSPFVLATFIPCFHYRPMVVFIIKASSTG